LIYSQFLAVLRLKNYNNLTCIIRTEGIFDESVIKEKWVTSILRGQFYFEKWVTSIFYFCIVRKNRGDPIFQELTPSCEIEVTRFFPDFSQRI